MVGCYGERRAILLDAVLDIGSLMVAQTPVNHAGDFGADALAIGGESGGRPSVGAHACLRLR